MVKPSQTPDLNIIESDWGNMKRQKTETNVNPRRT